MATTTQLEADAGKRTAVGAVEHLSVAERAARGKAARAAVPRASHATYAPPPDREDPLEVLERQARTRVPELVPIRYGRMLVSPFTFYRGAAMIMAGDLDATPRSGFTVQCCGDAHLSNFGLFASPERTLVFDLNDFDETLPGPWEWDVKRLAASILIAALNNGYSVKDQDRVVLATVESYRTAMREFAAMGNLEVWYTHVAIDAFVAEQRVQLKRELSPRTAKALAKARARDSMSAFSKLTEIRDGRIRIVDNPPLIVPVERLGGEASAETEAMLAGLLEHYRSTLDDDRRVLARGYEMVDLARKVVGVGSVGTRAWIALMLGRDVSDPLFLQIKEAQASVLEPYLGSTAFRNHGQRVVAGQRLMQATSDILLGWIHNPKTPDGQPRDFYVRQLRDWKGSIEVEEMLPFGLGVYGKLCGWTLARAHARSGDRIAIAAYLGGGKAFDRAILEFSRAYAEQNARDFQRLTDAVKAGTLAAQTGM